MTTSYVISGTPESGETTGYCPCPFKRGATGEKVPFHNRTIGNFMVYQERLEINLLPLFAHT